VYLTPVLHPMYIHPRIEGGQGGQLQLLDMEGLGHKSQRTTGWTKLVTMADQVKDFPNHSLGFIMDYFNFVL
jgi:hypothetical protein